VLRHIGSSFHNLWYKIHGRYMYIKKTTALRTTRRKTTVKNAHMRRLQTCVAPSTNRIGNERREIISLPNPLLRCSISSIRNLWYKIHGRHIKTNALRTVRGTMTLKKFTNAKATNIRSVEHKSYRQEGNISLPNPWCVNFSSVPLVLFLLLKQHIPPPLALPLPHPQMHTRGHRSAPHTRGSVAGIQMVAE
jgi:hypothetical protein